MIVTLEGPRAVGKTTLTDRIICENPEINVFEGYYIENTPKLIKTPDVFYENQRKYIKHKINQIDSINNNENYLIVRGPEGIEEYSLTYPKVYGYTWPVEDVLRKELDELRKRKSDIILYLDANIEVLKDRSMNDKIKYRNDYDEYLKLWYEKLRSSFLKYSNIKFLDTSNMSKDDVYNFVIGIFQGKK